MNSVENKSFIARPLFHYHASDHPNKNSVIVETIASHACIILFMRVPSDRWAGQISLFRAEIQFNISCVLGRFNGVPIDSVARVSRITIGRGLRGL